VSTYLGKDWQNAAQMTVTHVKEKSITRRVKGISHKLYMDNFLSFPDLLDDLHIRDMTCCITVRQNHKGLPENFCNKALKLKRGGINAR
jgi:hypothetical protein